MRGVGHGHRGGRGGRTLGVNRQTRRFFAALEITDFHGQFLGAHAEIRDLLLVERNLLLPPSDFEFEAVRLLARRRRQRLGFREADPQALERGLDLGQMRPGCGFALVRRRQPRVRALDVA